MHESNAFERLSDFEQTARGCLSQTLWHHLDAGSGDDHTLRANRSAFAQQTLTPRPLTNLRGAHTRLQLFGQALAHPILLAPIAYLQLFHAEGECAAAMAAAAQGGQAIISSLSSQPFDEIADAYMEGGGSAPWFQLYWQGDRTRTLNLLHRARAAGFGPVVFTVDAPVKQATLQLPEHIAAVNLEQALAPQAIGPEQSAVFDGWMTNAPTWEDLRWLRQQTDRPLLLKGILHRDDAVRAIEYGCDGLVVSNHGGRVLDGAPASLAVLPEIVAAVNGGVPVLFDSGIRSGRDVFKALSLGATAVLVGRPYVWGLATDGAMGVAKVIRILRDELEAAMALCGHAALNP